MTALNPGWMLSSEGLIMMLKICTRRPTGPIHPYQAMSYS